MFLDEVTPETPERHVLQTLAALSVASEEIESYGEHDSQFIEWYGPRDGQRVVFLHGGGYRTDMTLAHARPAALALGEEGYRVALVEVRKERGNPRLTMSDLSFLANRTDLSDAIWIGHSLGGTLVLDVALDPALPPRRAIALAPFFYLTELASANAGVSGIERWMGGMPIQLPELYRKFDPSVRSADLGETGYIDGCLNVQIIYGEDDQTVPAAVTRKIAETPIRTAMVPGTNHVDLIRPGHDAWLFLLGALRAE
ncbi:alpha/beta fold hydrolase [Arcanobacterium phocisimile]|uniref:Alpha/beta fold hydrolase n=1 Tax=Arcanobacterium phocisimile TaxID=1302235 RepID=A0ABX7IFZ1_9ACTO|nr:alpha/beta fold hydrolase [Arcanobacterium phocisimile]QRV01891.1 alpha/beta fold hydrolase [Arcanobacterium phocisimile]